MEDIYIFIALTFVFYFVFQFYSNFGLESVKATFDNNHYSVQSKEDKEQAANILAQIRQKLNKMYLHLTENFPNNECTQNLQKHYNEFKNITENNSSTGTSYTLNKKQIVMCIRNKDDEFVKINELTFVALHELAHICTYTKHHTPEFWNKFKFILREAVKIGVWKYIQYDKNPQEYCGITLNSVPNL